MIPVMELSILDNLNTAIRVDAKRYGISNLVLLQLAELYFEYYDHNPETLVDLLGVLL